MLSVLVNARERAREPSESLDRPFRRLRWRRFWSIERRDENQRSRQHLRSLFKHNEDEKKTASQQGGKHTGC